MVKLNRLNSILRLMFFDVQIFEDCGGKEYFTFRNYDSSQILFYDLNKGDLLFKLDFDKDGINAVHPLAGYYIEDMNNIYITSHRFEGIMKTDTTGQIKNRYEFKNTESGKPVVNYNLSMRSHLHTPLVVYQDKFYFINNPYIIPMSQTPITICMDTVNNVFSELPFNYHPALKDDQLQTHSSKLFSREFNDENFIYSFYSHEDIYISPLNKELPTKSIKVKSQYIDKLSLMKIDGDLQKIAREDLEHAMYGSLIYDKYRNVYCRFAYPEVELDPKVNWFKRSFFGRKKFSVIILDHNFNIIGETLFPEEIYNSYVYFVHEDGLYISDNYQINNDQSEDIVSFVCFDLVKK